jgi:hypothetical protein
MTVSPYTDPQVGDIVKILRQGETGRREWKVTNVDLPRVEVDLWVWSVLGPQWEQLSDLVFVRRPSSSRSH